MAKFNFEPLVRKLDSLGQLDAFKAAVKRHKKEIIALNWGQLDKGKNANNRSLGKYRGRDKYKDVGELINLKKSGDFRKAFEVEVDDTGINIYSIDWKVGILVHNYGEDIFGLNVTNSKEMMKIIRPTFTRILKRNAGAR